MKHDIENKYGAHGEIMQHAIEACVHCGFCLPACPTYAVMGDEMDSPRGRIFLMKEVLEETLPLHEATPHLDRCLGCAACVTACPSGVPYGELITTFRGVTEPQRERPLWQKAVRASLLTMLQNPRLFWTGAAMGRLGKPFARALPRALRAPLDLLPKSLQPMEALPERIPVAGKPRAKVAFLAGCAQRALEPNFNAATLRVLARNGVEVVIPKEQVCCGAAALHTGMLPEAQRLGRQNLKAFPRDVDAIVTNAAGCGSGLKEYGLVFAGGAEEADAESFAGMVKDISVFLMELGIEAPPPTRAPLNVAYHDACHLAHAQGVRKAPRDLIQSIPGVTLVEVPEGDLCCGSAGTYNIEQPAIAAELGQRKATHVRSTGANIVVSGNIGCHTQISSHLGQQGSPMRVMHTIELLDLAYRGEL